MNIFSSKSKVLTEGNRPPSPLARITFGRQTKKKTRERLRQSSDSLLGEAGGSDSPGSSPSHSPVLSGNSDYFFNRSHSLPLFRSKTDLRYVHIFGKYTAYFSNVLYSIVYEATLACFVKHVFKIS